MVDQVGNLIAMNSAETASSSDVNKNFLDLKTGINATIVALNTVISNYIKKDGSVAFTALQSYVSDLTPSDDKQLTPKKYVDDLVATTPAPAAYGLEISNNAIAPNTQMDISAGQCLDSTHIKKIISDEIITINLATTGANGLDTGSIAPSTTYHFFIISKEDGTVAGLASASLTPSLPTDYDYFQRRGSVKTDSSSHLLAFDRIGNKFLLNTPITVTSGASAWTSVTTPCPTGIRVEALLQLATGYVTGNPGPAGQVHVRGVGLPSAQYSVYVNPNAGGGDDTVGDYNYLACGIFTNTSAQVDYYCANTGSLACTGWVDNI